MQRLAVAAGACAGALPSTGFSSTRSAVVYVDYGEPIDVAHLAPGEWQELVVSEEIPVFILHRAEAQILEVRAVPLSELTDPARDEDRAPDLPWLVVSGTCTHAGCKVTPGLGPSGGWFCFCHGSYYDVSGRVRGGPAKRNLLVVPHAWVGKTAIVVVSAPRTRN